jgi:hypothetical protein
MAESNSKITTLVSAALDAANTGAPFDTTAALTNMSKVAAVQQGDMTTSIGDLSSTVSRELAANPSYDVNAAVQSLQTVSVGMCCCWGIVAEGMQLLAATQALADSASVYKTLGAVGVWGCTTWAAQATHGCSEVWIAAGLWFGLVHSHTCVWSMSSQGFSGAALDSKIAAVTINETAVKLVDSVPPPENPVGGSPSPSPAVPPSPEPSKPPAVSQAGLVAGLVVGLVGGAGVVIAIGYVMYLKGKAAGAAAGGVTADVVTGQGAEGKYAAGQAGDGPVGLEQVTLQNGGGPVAEGREAHTPQVRDPGSALQHGSACLACSQCLHLCAVPALPEHGR